MDDTISKLGEGTIAFLDSGERIFKLDSHGENPIVKPQDLELTWYENGKLKIGAVFNGGAELFEDKVILLPRCHKNYRKSKFFDPDLGLELPFLENYVSRVWPLTSEDGIHFRRLSNVEIRGDGNGQKDFCYGIEDIRITKHDREYLLIGCGKVKDPFRGKDADRIAIYSTKDFVDFMYHGIVKPFNSRNAIPFSEPIGGKFYMLVRFYPNIHLAVLEGGVEQLLNPARYEDQWKRIYERRGQNLLIKAGCSPHEREKLGPGTPLIKTSEGWLLIYHAVGEIKEKLCKAYGLQGKVERGYSICAALLDLEDPKKIICRSRKPIYIPSLPHELYGTETYPVDIPAVVFPTGALVRKGKLVLYAGAGDKYIILLSCNLGKLLDYLLEPS